MCENMITSNGFNSAMLLVREIVREIVFVKGLVLEKEFECEGFCDISIFFRRYLGLSNTSQENH
jgi:hypothetical protein